MKLTQSAAVALLLLLVSCSQRSTSIQEQQIDDLISQMTLQEKVGQLHQLNGFWDVTGPVPDQGDSKKKYEQLKNGLVGSVLNVRGVEQVRELQKIAVEETRLGIPLLFGFDLIHGYDIVIPEPMAEAASWDMDLIRRSAAMTAKEATAAGINWAFGPMIDISRDARWGRIMEGAGEFVGFKEMILKVLTVLWPLQNTMLLMVLLSLEKIIIQLTSVI